MLSGDQKPQNIWIFHFSLFVFHFHLRVLSDNLFWTFKGSAYVVADVLLAYKLVEARPF